MQSNSERQIWLRLTGPGVEDGHIPLAVLSVKLDALQKSVYNVATATSGMLSARGRWTNEILERCELSLVEVKAGSLELLVEVPQDPQVSMPHGRRLGPDGLRDFVKLTEAVAAEDTSAIRTLIPGYGARLRSLKSLETLCPELDADYAVEISGHNGAAPARLDTAARRYLRATSRAEACEDDYDTQTIIGRLVMIRVGGRDQIAIVSDQREIRCSYPSELEGVISQLVAGSLVEVTGVGRLDSQGIVQEISEVFSVDTVGLLPFRLKAFSWDNRRFILKRTLSCQPDFRNGLWVYECELLGLHAYAETREQAFRDFHEEFAAIWDGVAQEEDKALAPDALALKAELLNLVERVE